MFAGRQSKTPQAAPERDPVPGNWRFLDTLIASATSRRPELSAYDMAGKLREELGIAPDSGLPSIAETLCHVRGLQSSVARAFQTGIADQGLAATELPDATIITPYALYKSGLCFNANLEQDGCVGDRAAEELHSGWNLKIGGFSGLSRRTHGQGLEVRSHADFCFSQGESCEEYGHYGLQNRMGAVRLLATRFEKEEYIDLTNQEGRLPLDSEHRLLSYYRDHLFFTKSFSIERCLPHGERYGEPMESVKFELSAQTEVYHVEGRTIVAPLWFKLLIKPAENERYRVRIDPTGAVYSVKCFGEIAGVTSTGRKKSVPAARHIIESPCGLRVVATRNNIDTNCEAAFGPFREVWERGSLMRNNKIVEAYARRQVETFFPGLIDQGLNVKAALANMGNVEVPLAVAVGNRSTRNARTPQIVREFTTAD